MNDNVEQARLLAGVLTLLILATLILALCNTSISVSSRVLAAEPMPTWKPAPYGTPWRPATMTPTPTFTPAPTGTPARSFLYIVIPSPTPTPQPTLVWADPNDWQFSDEFYARLLP